MQPYFSENNEKVHILVQLEIVDDELGLNWIAK